MEDLDLVEALRQLPEDGFADVVAELVQALPGEVDAMFDDSTNLHRQSGVWQKAGPVSGEGRKPALRHGPKIV